MLNYVVKINLRVATQCCVIVHFVSVNAKHDIFETKDH